MVCHDAVAILEYAQGALRVIFTVGVVHQFVGIVEVVVHAIGKRQKPGLIDVAYRLRPRQTRAHTAAPLMVVGVLVACFVLVGLKEIFVD